MFPRSNLVPLALLVAATLPSASWASSPPAGAVWDSVAATLQTKDVFASNYHRFNLPRRDITLRVGGVTVAPELAQGAWAGFSDDPEVAMLMGDLVLTSAELRPVLAELTSQRLDVTAIHNHLSSTFISAATARLRIWPGGSTVCSR